jgi:hypothetical protein
MGGSVAGIVVAAGPGGWVDPQAAKSSSATVITAPEAVLRKLGTAKHLNILISVLL